MGGAAVAPVESGSNGNNKEPEKSNRRSDGKHWITTIWLQNAGDDAKGRAAEWFCERARKLAGVQAYVGQVEKCPESGRLHIQAYFRFAVKTKAVPRLEHAYGLGWYRVATSWKQSVTYCSKFPSRVEGPWIWDRDDTKAWEATVASLGEFHRKTPKVPEFDKKGNVIVSDAVRKRWAEVCKGLDLESGWVKITDGVPTAMWPSGNLPDLAAFCRPPGSPRKVRMVIRPAPDPDQLVLPVQVARG